MSLNWLNGEHKISAIHNSVPMIRLLSKHKCYNATEVEVTIDNHYHKECSCGIVSSGTLRMFGERLFEAQTKSWGECRYTLDECIAWERDLFTTKTLRGLLFEERAIGALRQRFPSLTVSETTGYLDEEAKIDAVVSDGGKVFCGVQVKPESYKKADSDVKESNKKGNELVDFPIFYLFYDNGAFTNMDEVATSIRAIWLFTLHGSKSL